MDSLAHELRLALLAGVNGLVLCGAWRFARRRLGGDPIAASRDTLLIYYLAQYLAVGLPGVTGALTAPMMLSIGAAIGAALWWLGGRGSEPRAELPQQTRWALLAAAALVLSYLAGLIWILRSTPQLANDPLTYHLPAAVEWLQQRRLTLFEAWLYNPANTYSPLAGSMFIAWLMAPLGNDVLANFVQMPALLLVFFVMIDLLRSLGARDWTALVAALAVVLSRPLLSQTLLAKDDLFVAAFFVAALSGLARLRRDDRWSAARVGVAIGLMLATKYTALLMLPVLALAIGARQRPAQWLGAMGIALLLAGPWYLRNLLLTGNPLYPMDVTLAGIRIFDGLFSTAASEQLRSWPGTWRAMAQGYYSLPAALWAAAALAWLGAVARFRWRALRDPLLRVCLLGPLLAIGLFVWRSPYDEVRFVLPATAVLVGLSALALPRPLDLLTPAIVLILALVSNFTQAVQVELLPKVAIAAPGIFILIAGWSFLSTQRQRAIAAVAVVFLISILVFVEWNAHLTQCRRHYGLAWRGRYGELADAWEFVRDQLPADGSLAYGNTFFVYPLYGFDLDRRVVYVPLRADLKRMHDLPHVSPALTGQQIVPAVAAATTANPDRDVWLANLRARKVRFLFVVRNGVQPDSVELTFCEQDPARFRRVFANPAARIYEIMP